MSAAAPTPIVVPPQDLLDRLAEVERRIQFIMESQSLSLNIPRGVLDAQGNMQTTQISGPLLSFYLKARAHGKSTLQQLVLADFQDVLDAAGQPSIAG